MKRTVLVLMVLTLSVSYLMAEWITSGEFRTRTALFYDIGEDMPTQSSIDSRFQLNIEKAFSEKLFIASKFQVGDVVWGKSEGMFPTDSIDIKLKNLYLGFLCPVTGMDAKIGFQDWSDPRSLVLNDDLGPFAGIMLSKEFGDGIMVEVGTAKIYEGAYDQDDDVDLIFLNVEKEMFGLNTIIGRSDAGKSIDAWLMPFFNYQMDNLALSILAAYNYGSYEDGDVSNNGFALSLNAKYYLDTVELGLDFLLASGDDGEDPESTSYFNTLKPFYFNGLEIFGRGIHSGLDYGDIGVDAHTFEDGIMGIVLTGAYPFSEKLTFKGAFGFLNAMEGDDTDIGIEIDLGINYKLYENLCFDLVGAMAMPGEYFGKDLDNTMALVSRIMYRF